MSYEYIQKPTLNVINAMKKWGTWSRLFARSLETRNEDILVREGDPRFWDYWAMAKMRTQLEEEVERCVIELRRRHVEDRRSKKELKPLFEKALVESGWKPNLSLIRREIQALKKERREEISWLKSTVRMGRQRRRSK